jgi:hypothetical protein
MSEKALAYDSIRDTLFSAFPEVAERLPGVFGSYYDLEKGTPDETPEAYPIFEDLVQKLVFELLDGGQDDGLLTRLFTFFEDMAGAKDANVKDLLTISILENLVYRRESLRRAWKYMGPQSRELAVLEAKHQGRPENLPSADTA